MMKESIQKEICKNKFNTNSRKCCILMTTGTNNMILLYVVQKYIINFVYNLLKFIKDEIYLEHFIAVNIEQQGSLLFVVICSTLFRVTYEYRCRPNNTTQYHISIVSTGFFNCKLCNLAPASFSVVWEQFHTVSCSLGFKACFQRDSFFQHLLSINPTFIIMLNNR